MPNDLRLYILCLKCPNELTLYSSRIDGAVEFYGIKPEVLYYRLIREIVT